MKTCKLTEHLPPFAHLIIWKSASSSTVLTAEGEEKYGIIIQPQRGNGDMKTVISAIVLATLLFGIAPIAIAVPNSNSIIEDGIEYYTQTNKSIYNLGEDVEMLFRVTNLRSEDVLIGCSRSGEFNFLVEKNDDAIWAAAHWFVWFSPGVELSVGESKNISYTWDMINDNDSLVDPGIYDVVGVMYNESWNYYNHGNPYATEVAVPIIVVPEPASFFLLSLGCFLLKKGRK
jgi:hypothetical protein